MKDRSAGSRPAWSAARRGRGALALFALLLLLAAAAFPTTRAATWYVDSATGDDANTGRASDRPWKTLKPGAFQKNSTTLPLHHTLCSVQGGGQGHGTPQFLHANPPSTG